MIQAIINSDGINVIEFGARFGGGESFRIIKLLTGFDITDAAVDSFLGKQIKLHIKKPQFYFADNFIYSKSGVFGEIINYKHLLSNSTIEYLDSYKTKGSKIGDELSSNNRVGVFTVQAEKKSVLFEKINDTIKSIDVTDFYGNFIMRKDIYKNIKTS